jgi:hypothetical protein
MNQRWIIISICNVKKPKINYILPYMSSFKSNISCESENICRLNVLGAVQLKALAPMVSRHEVWMARRGAVD